jgi:DNA topoisomerase-3
MKLCIAEKPSVAKELADILGAASRRDGYYEGNGYWVSWTYGHLCMLKMPEDYHPDLKRWSLLTLPIIPPRFQIKLNDNEGARRQFHIIEKLVADCDEVINCGDAGQEGELIQRWVLSQARNTKPVRRLWISSLTAEAIREGFNKLRPGSDFDRLFHAGHARAISDWLLGINATRLFTAKYSHGRGVLSIGRVQTPTLALIVKRHLEIQNFTPEDYWELKTVYRSVTFSATQGRFKSAEEASETLEKIRESLFTITSFERKKGTEAPPRLFDLTSLQVECNKKYAFSADETLVTIQSLYEKKQVTYPRVDTTFLPDDLYPKVPDILRSLAPYSQFTSQLLDKKIKKSKKVFDNSKVTDHHAIIPTGEFNPHMSGNEKRVFDLIARRFIAAFFPDAIVSNTTVLGEAAEIPFKATGKQILDEGWRVVMKKSGANSIEEADEKGDKEAGEDQVMPEFVKGESGPHEPGVQQKQTQPPKPYTEATLLRAMETAGKQIEDEELRDALKENGIGRPSTRASIIETLFKRNYIRRNKKNLEPTATGVGLIATIDNELLKSAELTGQWERKLRQIERGEYDASAFLGELKGMVTSLVSEVISDLSARSITVEKEPEPVEKKTLEKKADNKEIKVEKTSDQLVCPACGTGQIVKGRTAWGCNRFREGCGFRIPFEFCGRKITDKQVVTLIAKGKTPMIKGFISDGQKVDGKIILTPEKKLQLEVEQALPKQEVTPMQLKCPQCETGFLIAGKTAFGCSRWKEGCMFKIPFESISSDLFGEKPSPDQVSDYLKRNLGNSR